MTQREISRVVEIKAGKLLLRSGTHGDDSVP